MDHLSPPPLQGGYALTAVVGTSNAMRLDETQGCYLKSIRSDTEPPIA